MGAARVRGGRIRGARARMSEQNEAGASAPSQASDSPSDAAFNPFASPFSDESSDAPADEPSPDELAEALSDLSEEEEPSGAAERDGGGGCGRRAPRPTRLLLRRAVPMLAFAATVALVGWVIYSGVEGLLRSNTLEARIAETQQEIADLQCQADELAAMVAWLESDEYVERTAREDLGLVRPAEEAFAVHAPPREGLSIVRSPWWANLLHESVCG